MNALLTPFHPLTGFEAVKRNKVTILDIAKTAQVSKSTVSRVLNNTTPVNEKKKKAVLAAMKKLNYKPNAVARSLAGGNSCTLGVVTQNIGSPFYDSVAQGIIHELIGTDYSPLIADGRWDVEIETNVIETLVDRNVDGLVLVGGLLSASQLNDACGGRPFVVVGRRVEGLEERCLAIDNVEASDRATQFLIDSGHKKIVHLMGIEHHLDAQDRLKGYQQALARANIDFDPNLVVAGDFSSQAGVIGVESILLRNLSFTAIYCGNDEMAYGARLALYRRGIRVPDDVSIIGFDNQPFSAFMTPPLTTVAQPASEMGGFAAKHLLEMIQSNNDQFEKPDLTCELIVRESVKRYGQ